MDHKKEHPKEKSSLHPRNGHRERYDFKRLMESCPALAPFVKLNIYGDESIDFFDPVAVKMLNRALLKSYYDIDEWDIPPQYLCPPIPGRADYVHYVADLLSSCNENRIPTGSHINCLDIGVGANCVYPIIGNKVYGWSFTGSDIDPKAIESAGKIIANNPFLKDKVALRLQNNAKDIFKNIIKEDEYFDLTICNPPFHATMAAAQAGTMRKLNNLKQQKNTRLVQNFGGQNLEICCAGGEANFVRNMAIESAAFATSCCWFTTLISKESNLNGLYEILKEVRAEEIRTIPMSQGNKKSRIVAWTFLTKAQQKVWKTTKWKKRL